MSKLKKYLSLTLAAALIMGLGVTGIALAQGDTSAKPQTSLQQIYLEKLAGVLGISQDQLVNDLKTAGQQTVDTAVSEGLITADQGQKIKQEIAQGRFPGLHGMFDPEDSHPGMRGLHNLDAIASALGITPQQLTQEFKNGKSLQQLATEKGLSLDQIKESIIKAVKSKLDQEVAQGKISQDKATQILNHLQQLDLTKFPNHVK
ncbi:hypothetical protein MOOR_04220 [Moorella thermoacetica]|uniref:Uncharacterized protein n=1 Tax=Neomoorella thermoacetica TaxID=1525 RepID=A0A1J5JJ75_NEOTH|nr:hypothetical protein [Moorella thermoacetica]OIQ09582.1 hypothetical protein MOOR_04220 [Moorella thermoacetica]